MISFLDIRQELAFLILVNNRRKIIEGIRYFVMIHTSKWVIDSSTIICSNLDKVID